jgi:hypothetical protein
MKTMTATTLLLALLLAAAPAPARAAAKSGTADKTTLELVGYFLKVPTAQASPKLIQPFLAVDVDTLPPRLRRKTRAKQIQIRTLIKVHDARKKGMIVQPAAGCTLDSIVRPTSDETAYMLAGFQFITEDEEHFVLQQTKCQEEDLGCEFSLVIFHDAGSKKPRKLALHVRDPLMGLVARYREKGSGSTHFFGSSLFCPSK